MWSWIKKCLTLEAASTLTVFVAMIVVAWPSRFGFLVSQVLWAAVAIQRKMWFLLLQSLVLIGLDVRAFLVWG
jgi:hypothetical protein